MDDSVERRFHSVEKYPGNPVITKTQSDSIEGMGPIFWGSVLHDQEEGLFKLWCEGITFKEPEIVNNFYLTSEDGIHWTKPELGIVGPDNRVAPPGYSHGHGGIWITARKDVEEVDPQRRYKGFIQNNRFDFMTSPDGLHWKDEGVAAYSTDDTTTAVYHLERDEYLKIGRFCPDGRSLALRLIMTCTSKTPLAEGNSPWTLVMLPEEKDLEADS